MQLAFTGAVPWSQELECYLCFIVVVVVWNAVFICRQLRTAV